MADVVSFRIFIGDGQWKLNRNEEFVCVFDSRDGAIDACLSFRDEIEKHGGAASIVINEPDGTESSV
ncbi:MAG: hypothetical protein KL863_18755 [Rhizobium sp.]|nr:hypothetical protein [Rhizobium sp.]